MWPAQAAWRHRGLRDGFEVAFFESRAAGVTIRGATSAVESGVPWHVEYVIDVDEQWRTRTAVVRATTARGSHSARLDADGAGTWHVDNVPAPQLDGCIDVDLESSAVTNALPVRRLAFGVGSGADVPAAYVRVDLTVERLDQNYLRLEDESGYQQYGYGAPAFDFTATLRYAADGLVLDYPGIAERHDLG